MTQVIVEDSTQIERVKSRIVRTMMNEISGKWSVQVTAGSAWISLRKEDALLITRCEQDEGAFKEGVTEHVYKVDGQPLVELIEVRGAFQLYSVWNGVRYVTHEDKDPAPPTKQVAVEQKKGSTPLTIEKIDASIDASIQNYKRGMRKQAEGSGSGNIMISPETDAEEEFNAMVEVTLNADGTQDALGKVQLRAFWRMRSSGVFRASPGKPLSILSAVSNYQYKRRDYVLSMARVVDTIFPDVEAMSKSSTPYLDPRTNTPITVETLTMEDGMINKLSKSATHWTTLMQPEDKLELIQAIVGKPRQYVTALRAKQSKVGKKSQLVKCRIETLSSEKTGGIPMQRITLDCTDTQLQEIMKRIARYIDDPTQGAA